ncbi:polysaccharide biosynthesis/export family protein [Hyphomicrobiales bacterium]
MRISAMYRRGIVFTTVIALSSCTSLPRSGPDHVDFDKKALIKVTTPERKVGIDYVLIDFNKAILPYFEDVKANTLQAGFGGGRGGAPDIPLGYGDMVQVSIFEAQSGGLFIPSDAGSRPGNYITLPQQTIDRTGTISVPYAGRVPAAGRLKEEVERDIEDRLATRAIEPQVVVTTTTSRSSEVAVVGDVKDPQKVPVTPAGDRVLDVISTAGGLTTPNIETNITLQRRGKIATVAYETLLKNPAENIFVAPGDTISVEHERRTYIALGASGLNARIEFEDSNLTLGEAIAKAGGVLDNRADPREVVVYRQVDRNILKKLNIDVSRFQGAQVPVIFRANMRDPATLFAIQQFRMADKDVLYISNASSVELVKFLDILNSITSTISGVSDDANSTKNSINDLGN